MIFVCQEASQESLRANALAHASTLAEFVKRKISWLQVSAPHTRWTARWPFRFPGCRFSPFFLPHPPYFEFLLQTKALTQFDRWVTVGWPLGHRWATQRPPQGHRCVESPNFDLLCPKIRIATTRNRAAATSKRQYSKQKAKCQGRKDSVLISLVAAVLGCLVVSKWAIRPSGLGGALA